MKFETNVWIDAADVNRLTKVSNLNLRKWFDEKYGDEAASNHLLGRHLLKWAPKKLLTSSSNMPL